MTIPQDVRKVLDWIVEFGSAYTPLEPDQIVRLREWMDAHSEEAEKRVEAIVNNACDSAKKDLFPSREAINWADLYCVEVAYDGEKFNVLVEEAAPNATELQLYILDRLAEAGYLNVEVRTEW